MTSRILILSGPTASGKTDLSLKLAAQANACIVNFDSLLFYQELNIGTAKPTLSERGSIPHYMIDIVSAKQPINAARFRELCLPVLEKLNQNSTPIILVGGSGFYLQALIHGMYPSPTTPEKIIQLSQQMYEEQGITPFREILKLHDHVSYEKYHENDHYRIRRAVEHWWSHNFPFSEAQKHHQENRQPLPYPQYHCFLDIPKEEHWKIIQQRTQQMIKNGLIDEVKNLLTQGFNGKEKPLQSIGYKETVEFIQTPSSLDELSEKITISTRQLAKSQRTWFKKIRTASYHPLLSQKEFFHDAMKFLRG